MAKFCACVDLTYKGADKEIDWQDILTNGHRGYISHSEDDLAKLFDKKLEFLRDKYSVIQVDKKNSKSYSYGRDSTAELEMWYEEGVAIANEIFEEEFLK